MKHAIALAEQVDAKQEIKRSDLALAQEADALDRVTKELRLMQEQVALLEKLSKERQLQAELQQRLDAQRAQASEEQKNLQTRLATEKLRAQAQERIAGAELKVKSADAVAAETYAKSEYAAAMVALERARVELTAGTYEAAITSAHIAAEEAQKSIEVARPEFVRVTEAAQSKARAEALARDAASIPGVVMRRDARGALQRLILPLPSKDFFGVGLVRSS